RQDVFLPADHQRVAGIVATLETCDGRGFLGQQVDDLALALVAPLGADDDYETTHVAVPCQKKFNAPGTATAAPAPCTPHHRRAAPGRCCAPVARTRGASRRD